jgi:hypothetical protein
MERRATQLGLLRVQRDTQRRPARAPVRAHHRLRRRDANLRRTTRERVVEQHARLVLGEVRQPRDDLELDLDRRLAVAQRRLVAVEERAEHHGIADGIDIRTEHERRHLAVRARHPQPADRLVDLRDRSLEQRDRRDRPDAELDRARPPRTVDEPGLERTVLADREQPARLLAPCIVDDDWPQHDAAHRTLVPVIATAIGGLDVTDDKTRPDRAITASQHGTAIAHARDRADAAIAARRDRTHGVGVDDTKLTVRTAREPQPGGVPRHAGDRPVRNGVLRTSLESRRAVLHRKPQHVQRTVGGAGGDHTGIAARDTGIDRQRADRCTERDLGGHALARDVPCGKPTVLSTGQ